VRIVKKSATGGMYGLQNLDGRTAVGPDSLVRIDPSSVATSVIGVTGFSASQGLVIDAAGKAFGWDIQLGLLRIDLATCAATAIGSVRGIVEIQTLAFASDGWLYGRRESLYEIKPSTGDDTLIREFSGSGFNHDVRGWSSLPRRFPSRALTPCLRRASRSSVA
jgi:hypothetical protein